MFEDNEDDKEANSQKVHDMKQYRELLRELPQYEAFIRERPKVIIKNEEQVEKALREIPVLEDQLKLLGELFTEGKELLYIYGLKILDKLAFH